MRSFASVSMLIPVFCPVLFMASSKEPASLVDMPKASSTFWVLSMEVDTSVLFNDANLMNCAERSSRACPVRPNLVFTSPMALPAVSKSVGIWVARFFTDCCMASSASPEAPVFCTTISMPESTS